MIIVVFVFVFANISPNNYIQVCIGPFLTTQKIFVFVLFKKKLNPNIFVFIIILAKKCQSEYIHIHICPKKITRIYSYLYLGLKIKFVTHWSSDKKL